VLVIEPAVSRTHSTASSSIGHELAGRTIRRALGMFRAARRGEFVLDGLLEDRALALSSCTDARK